MFEFFGAVAGALAIAAPVMKNLGDIAQGSRRMLDFADRVLSIFQRKVPAAQQQIVIRQAMTQAAAMPPVEFEKKVQAIVDQVLADQTPEDRKAATEFLKLIPNRIRSTFASSDDPSGTSVPPNWDGTRVEDIAAIFPARLPRFKEGDRPPGAPKWMLVERLAIGGFGEVWKARSDSLHNTFRVFKFCLDPASQIRIFENELENIELVQNELVDHPNIVKLIEAHLEGDAPWLQYEYVPGGDLSALIATWPKELAARAANAVETMNTLATTLEHCHNRITWNGKPRAVIHRDMKPANVLVGKNGTLKITDFGISITQARQALDEARIATATGMTLSTPSLVGRANTPMYASPQQKDGEKPHTADDVHALGVMMYQMILGNVNRPLYHDYRDILERRRVCPQLVECVVRGTASERGDRYQHAGELMEVLKRLPKKLVVEPGVAVPVEDAKSLYEAFDLRAAEAKAKNATASKLLLERKWGEAVTALESVFHPVLRDADLYSRAVQHRDGKQFMNELGMEFSLIPAGTFWMGGQEGKCGDKEVHIDEDFYLGVYPVTQAEWEKEMGKNPSHFRKGGGGAALVSGISDADLKRFPVETVSWEECQLFIRKLNEKLNVKEKGWAYRLPREAEWEYACRGAATTQKDCAWSFYFKSPTNTLSAHQANFADSGFKRTTKVGSYAANPQGLHDMHGNVWEWCEDSYDGSFRVFRGGSWGDSAEYCRAAHRRRYDPTGSGPNLGLRLARVPVR